MRLSVIGKTRNVVDDSLECVTSQKNWVDFDDDPDHDADTGILNGISTIVG